MKEIVDLKKNVRQNVENWGDWQTKKVLWQKCQLGLRIPRTPKKKENWGICQLGKMPGGERKKIGTAGC